MRRCPARCGRSDARRGRHASSWTSHVSGTPRGSAKPPRRRVRGLATRPSPRGALGRLAHRWPAASEAPLRGARASHHLARRMRAPAPVASQNHIFAASRALRRCRRGSETVDRVACRRQSVSGSLLCTAQASHPLVHRMCSACLDDAHSDVTSAQTACRPAYAAAAVCQLICDRRKRAQPHLLRYSILVYGALLAYLHP